MWLLFFLEKKEHSLHHERKFKISGKIYLKELPNTFLFHCSLKSQIPFLPSLKKHMPQNEKEKSQHFCKKKYSDIKLC
jgi:hypothetical protein